jgi:hypothetical protein
MIKIFNLHLPFSSNECDYNYYAENIKLFLPDDMPFLLCGDFNACFDNKLYYNFLDILGIKINKRINTNTIKNISPFLSTTTNKKMAELFVEKDWDQPEKSQRVGHLFKIHLKGAIALSTRDINYTLTDEVKEELRKINRNRKIEKGDGTYTFDEFFPKIKKLMKELLFPTTDNGEEFLVLNGGIFYKDVELKRKGFSPIKNGDFETWYISSKLFNKTRKSKS